MKAFKVKGISCVPLGSWHDQTIVAMFIYKVTEGHKRLSNKLQNAKNNFAKKVTKAEAEEVLDVENVLKGGAIQL